MIGEIMNKKRLEQLLLTVQKPGRYSGGEVNQIVKNKDNVDVRFAFCFPDTYEIGMSHLGMKILYSLFNERDDIWCERVFAPWIDFEKVMRDENIPLYALESRDSIREFDFVGFTLQYELSYTNILTMLDLGGIPLKACDRDDSYPIIVAGGPCTCNAEPLADFIDIFFLGEGEKVDLEVIDLYKQNKAIGGTKIEYVEYPSGGHGIWNKAVQTEGILDKLFACELYDRYPEKRPVEPTPESSEAVEENEKGFFNATTITLIISVAIAAVITAVYTVIKKKKA